MTSTMKRARRSCNVGTKDQEQEELFDEGITSSVVHPKRFPVDISGLVPFQSFICSFIHANTLETTVYCIVVSPVLRTAPGYCFYD